MDPPFAYGCAKQTRKNEKENEKEKEKRKGREGKWRKELSDESRLHSSAIQRAAPRCRARVKQCARPFTEWKHGRRRGVDGNARRLAASNPATVPSLSLTELNGPAHVVARTSYVVNLHLVRLLDRSMISDDFARINTHRPWDLPRFVR